MPREIRNYSSDEYQQHSHIHIKASGQLSLEDYRRDLLASGELTKDIVAQEVELDTNED